MPNRFKIKNTFIASKFITFKWIGLEHSFDMIIPQENTGRKYKLKDVIMMLSMFFLILNQRFLKITIR